MADRADANVKNCLTQDIRMVRRLPDGSTDMEAVIANGNTERIHLPDPDVSLVIFGPEGVDTKTCHAKVTADVDLAVAHSRSNSNWTISIVANSLPPDSPSDINIEVGENET